MCSFLLAGMIILKMIKNKASEELFEKMNQSEKFRAGGRSVNLRGNK
jgi:hypothetical protein